MLNNQHAGRVRAKHLAIRALESVLFIPDAPVLMPMMPLGMPRPYMSPT